MRRRLLLAGVTIVAVTGLVALAVLAGGLRGLSRQLVDVQYPTGPVDDRIRVVELSLTQLDEWTRSDHAALVDALAAAGASAVGYDVVFDRDDGDAAGQQALAESAANAGNVVLGASVVLRIDDEVDLPQAAATTGPLPALTRAAAGLGHVDVLVDPLDGVVRRVPTVIEDGRALVPALSLATVAVAAGQDPSTVTLRAGGDVQIADRLVPTGEHRIMEVNWASGLGWSAARGNPEHAVSASQVLAGSVDLTDAIVFVGAADQLLDADIKQTPTAKNGMPGVYVHANAANTVLTGLFRSGPDDRTTILAAFVLASLLAVSGVLLRLVVVPVVALLLLLAWQAIVNVRFQTGEALDSLWPTVAVLLATGGVVGVRYVTEARERRRVARLFRQYVPDRVADELIASERLEAVEGGERVEVTVFFCDLRGFTATAAGLPPAAVRQLLEIYYDHATQILFDHDATVMQFVGDEVFAVFGAPVPQADHAQRAVDAARALQAAQGEINAELAAHGVEIAYGIGLNTGTVVAAHVGSRVHRQYAVVGNTVNVGARLCSIAEAGEIVASRTTRSQASDLPVTEPVGEVSLKGVAEDPEPHRLVL